MGEHRGLCCAPTEESREVLAGEIADRIEARLRAIRDAETVAHVDASALARGDLAALRHSMLALAASYVTAFRVGREVSAAAGDPTLTRLDVAYLADAAGALARWEVLRAIDGES